MTSRAPTTRGGGPSAVALAVAGSVTVATAFGMARYGYGLLLPDIQDDPVLGATAMGAIGTFGLRRLRARDGARDPLRRARR